MTTTTRIPNPATGSTSAVTLTDRAQRYRAQKAIAQPGRKRCIYCGKPSGPLMVDHINGKESDNNPRNLVYACRSCNTKKGAHYARRGKGVRTRQYNPPAKAAANLAQWIEMAKALKGEPSTMTLDAAQAMLSATGAERRSRFAEEIWRIRRARGTDKWAAVPF